MGDLFKDRLNKSRLALKGELKDKYKVSSDTAFLGFDAYKQVIASDVDLVLLTTPAGFRPIHLKAAIEGGKHAFVEKPCATDPVGVRSVLASSALATEKKLAIVAGTQRRHQFGYVETVKRIHDGAIGGIIWAETYWNQGAAWVIPRKPEWSDMEWQIRNWHYFTWIGGDHVVEQHVHNIDIINWVMDAHPVRAFSSGGREVRTAPEYGYIYDHFTTDFEYPNGVRVVSMCRQQEGTKGDVREFVQGIKGKADPAASIDGPTAFKYKGPNPNPYVQEHADLIASIRAGRPLNEGRQIAESTLTAMMGRMSAYTGQEVTWDFAMNSKLDLFPPKLELGPLPVVEPAVPGKTKLI